jgi:hypothetical protein
LCFFLPGYFYCGIIEAADRSLLASTDRKEKGTELAVCSCGIAAIAITYLLYQTGCSGHLPFTLIWTG